MRNTKPQSGGYVRSGRGRDIVLVLTVFGLFLFASPFTAWWAGLLLPWYAPFILWGALIILVVVTQRFGHGFED